MSVDQKMYLTVDEAGEILRIGRNLAYRLAKAGTLPGVVRLGKQYRVVRAVLMQERCMAYELKAP